MDTSVWSLAMRRDGRGGAPAVVRLRDALNTGEAGFRAGLVLQELLQGLGGAQSTHGHHRSLHGAAAPVRLTVWGD